MSQKLKIPTVSSQIRGTAPWYPNRARAGSAGSAERNRNEASQVLGSCKVQPAEAGGDKTTCNTAQARTGRLVGA